MPLNRRLNPILFHELNNQLSFKQELILGKQKENKERLLLLGVDRRDENEKKKILL